MVRKVIREKILSPLQEIVKDSRTVGIILFLCTVVSMVIANSASLQTSYLALWGTEWHLPDAVHIPHSLLHFINDAFMAVFFFMVGMEIKRELLVGELREPRKALLPVFGALGGMLVPALCYALLNKGTVFLGGWGIPMATDIAFSLGVASLLGPRVPVALKIFLTALAIIDDLGAIITIAIFYGGRLQLAWAGGALAIIAVLWLLSRSKVRFGILHFLLGLVLWYCVFNSGIHATVAGVIFAFFVPLDKLQHLEHRLHVPVNFFILPLFALANTAIVINGGILSSLDNTLIAGILAGLVLGKPLGILAFCALVIRLGWGKLPEHVNWMQMAGVGMLAGIGFTMSIFMTMLAFLDPAMQDTAKIGVLAASLLSILTGSITLNAFSKKLTPQG
jgi:Na+:H+ antiporter, NhaA family